MLRIPSVSPQELGSHERSRPLLDPAAIQDAFRRLGDRLVRRGVVADIYVVGGVAMALAYDGRRSTRDIDAVFQPPGIVLEESAPWRRNPGFPHGGSMNRPAPTSSLAGHSGLERLRSSRSPGLRGLARALLAMKVLASRRRDSDDIRYLIKHLGLSSAAEVLEVCASVFPMSRLPTGLD
jgi:hypothetical protein